MTIPFAQDQPHALFARWAWSSHDLNVVPVWLEICAVLVIWLS